VSLALPRLLQLASPALPVGAYTYSQGLEWAVEAGLVHDQATALEWITGLLEHGVGRFEAPLTACLQRAWAAAEEREVERLNADFLASRESSELRAETVQMGYSLRRLLHELDDFALPEALRCAPRSLFPGRLGAGRCRLGNRRRRFTDRLSMVLVREPDDGGAQGCAARPGCRAAHPPGSGWPHCRR
jgi:urease accessory protein UreF